MSYLDLHCHWLPGVDDGARTLKDSEALLNGLKRLGFDQVVATPHIRPGLFNNARAGLIKAYQRSVLALNSELPRVALSAEHYFDDVVYARIQQGEGLPYPGQDSVLLEFYESHFPPQVLHALAALNRSGLTPVIAHPERYRAIWNSTDVMQQLKDVGALGLLDLAALTGAYGRKPERTARRLLEDGLYTAACSDAHKLSDLRGVERSMKWVDDRYGRAELELLLTSGPQRLLGKNNPVFDATGQHSQSFSDGSNAATQAPNLKQSC